MQSQGIFNSVILPILLGLVSSVIYAIATQNLYQATLVLAGMTGLLILLNSIREVSWRIRLLNNRTGLIAIHENQDSALKHIQSKLKNAREIDVLAIRALGIVGLKDAVLRKPLCNVPVRPVFRVLLLAEDSPYTLTRAMEIGEDTDRFVTALKAGRDGVAEFRRTSGCRVELRLYKSMPIWRIVRIDDIMFISWFAPNTEGHHAPVHEIRSGGRQSLFGAFMRQFDHLWNEAENVTLR